MFLNQVNRNQSGLIILSIISRTDEASWHVIRESHWHELIEYENFIMIIIWQRQEQKRSDLDEQLKDYIAEWRKQRAKEEEELKRLKVHWWNNLYGLFIMNWNLYDFSSLYHSL